MAEKVLTKRLKAFKIDVITNRHTTQMNSMKYFMTVELPVTNMKILEINENYGLDCEEFDDNVTRTKNKIERLNATYNQKTKEIDEKYGIKVYEDNINTLKTDELKNFVDELAKNSRELNYQINQIDVRIKARAQEATDEIKSLTRQLKQKLNDLKNKYNIAIDDIEMQLLKKSEVIEKELLNEFDHQSIKALIDEEKKLREASINERHNQTTTYLNDILSAKRDSYKEIEDSKVNSEKEIVEMKLKKIEIKRSVDEILEKIKLREEYYSYNTLDDEINYISELSKQIDNLIKEANDNAYMLYKDITSNKSKRFKFEEKEYQNIIKNITNIISSNLESLSNFYPQLIEFSSLNIEEKHYKKIIPAFKGFIEDKRDFYIDLCEGYLISQLGKIRYIDYDTKEFNDKLKNEIINLFDDITNDVNNLESTCSNTILKAFFKKYNQLDSNVSKIVKNILKDLQTSGKEFILEKTKESIIEVNKETIEIDETFKKCMLLDNSLQRQLLDGYSNKQEQLKNQLVQLESTISHIGLKASNVFNEEKNKLDSEYKEYLNKCSSETKTSNEVAESEFNASVKASSIAKEKEIKNL